MIGANGETPVTRGMQLLQAGRVAEAESAFRELLRSNPNDAEVYNQLGRALNNQRRLEEAEQAFREAIRLAPGHAEAHNNLGHVLRAQGRLENAGDCFRRACELRPDYVAAHFNLGTVHSLQGEHARALPCFGIALKHDPDHIPSAMAFCTALHVLGRLDEAAKGYREVLERHPDSAEARLNLGTVLAELRQPDAAEKQLREAIRLEPGVPDAWAQLASLLEELNRTDESEEAAREGLVIDPSHLLLNLAMARCERRAGKLEEARQRLSGFDPGQIESRVRRQYHFEMGLAQDGLGEYEAAWSSFARANAIGSLGERARNVNRNRYLDRIEHIQAFYEKEDPSTWPSLEPTDDETDPVFLMGFTRSGTTLAELALDAHPDLESIEEQPTLNAVEGAIERLPGGYPAALKSLTPEQLADLRAVYFAEVRKHVDADRGKRVIDKLPLRTIHAGLIWRIFPNAGIILSVRHPCDVCLSNFTQQYEPSDTMANFDTVEHAAVAYNRVMSLWSLYAGKLPLRYHLLRYEDLVEDFNGEMRKLLDFIGVPWSDAVSGYQERARSRKQINTNSYYQVTQPLYRDALYRWRRYEKHLEPVMQLLAPHIHSFGYDTE